MLLMLQKLWVMIVVFVVVVVGPHEKKTKVWTLDC